MTGRRAFHVLRLAAAGLVTATLVSIVSAATSTPPAPAPSAGITNTPTTTR